MNIHCLFDEMVSPSKLIPHPKNPNKHDKAQVERLAQILEYQGFRYAIKVSKLSGFITSGHGRLEAAKHLKLKTVPVVFQDYDDDAQEYADIVADNAIASWAKLELGEINIEIQNLGPEFDIDLMGIKGFTIDIGERLEDDLVNHEEPSKWMLEVTLPNQMEMDDIHDDLVSRGYIVKKRMK